MLRIGWGGVYFAPGDVDGRIAVASPTRDEQAPAGLLPVLPLRCHAE